MNKKDLISKHPHLLQEIEQDAKRANLSVFDFVNREIERERIYINEIKDHLGHTYRRDSSILPSILKETMFILNEFSFDEMVKRFDAIITEVEIDKNVLRVGDKLKVNFGRGDLITEIINFNVISEHKISANILKETQASPSVIVINHVHAYKKIEGPIFKTTGDFEDIFSDDVFYGVSAKSTGSDIIKKYKCNPQGYRSGMNSTNRVSFKNIDKAIEYAFLNGKLISLQEILDHELLRENAVKHLFDSFKDRLHIPD